MSIIRSKSFYYFGALFVGFFAGGGPITSIIFFLIVRYMIKKGWIATSANEKFKDREEVSDGYIIAIFYIAKKVGQNLDEVEDFIIKEEEKINKNISKNKAFKFHISYLKNDCMNISEYIDDINENPEEILYSLTEMFFPYFSDMAIKEISLLAEMLGKSDYYKKIVDELSEKQEDSGMSKYFKILGCDENASEQEIKTCYKRKISEFHPDKIEGKGLSDSFIRFANEESSRINEAYEKIRKLKGF